MKSSICLMTAVLFVTCTSNLFALKSWEKPYPCIESFECSAASEFDENIAEVSVTYYDDLGKPMKWTRQLHSMENPGSCEAAMNENFPYTFFKKCAAKESE